MIDLIAQIFLALIIAGFYGMVAQDVWDRVKNFEEK